MTADFQSEQIRELQTELTYLRRQLFGDSREGNGDSLRRTIRNTEQAVKDTQTDTQSLRISQSRMLIWGIFLTAGLVVNITILLVLAYLIIAVDLPV